MRCPYCNNWVSRRAERCVNCGKSLRNIRNDIIICKNCGAENFGIRQFCHNCSARISRDSELNGKDRRLSIIFLKLLKKIALKIGIFITIIIALNLIVIVIYDIVNNTENLNNLPVIFIIEGGLIMGVAVWASTLLPQVKSLTIHPLLSSKTVPVVRREIIHDRSKQATSWISIGLTGLVLFLLGLFSC